MSQTEIKKIKNDSRMKNNFSSFVVDLRPRFKAVAQAERSRTRFKNNDLNSVSDGDRALLARRAVLHPVRRNPGRRPSGGTGFLKRSRKPVLFKEKILWQHFLPPFFWPRQFPRRTRRPQPRSTWSLAELFRRDEKKSFLKYYCHRLRSDFKHFSAWSFTHVTQVRTQLQDKFADGSSSLTSWPRQISRSFSPPRQRRPIGNVLIFALILFILILPFKVMSYYFDLGALKDRILSHSQAGVDTFLSGAKKASGLDLSGAQAEFSAAGQKFLAAQAEADSINKNLLALAALSSDPKIKMAAEGQKFLAAGAAAASLGQNLTAALNSLFNSPDQDLPHILDNFSYYGALANRDLNKLNKNLAAVKVDNLPTEYRAEFLSLRSRAQTLALDLGVFVSNLQSLKEFLGLSQDKRYLLVFQNNTELRASGGFLGSYALVDFHDGKIKNLEVPGGGSYDTEAGLKEKIIAPAPLWLVNPQWHFWDANWWPDWPTTARNLMWFYEKSDGPTVDGVISFTPTVVERLLEVTGPIDLRAEYGVVVDANNFWDTVQTVVENKDQGQVTGAAKASSSILASTSLTLDQGLENNSANKPKKIIGDLLAKILEILPQKLNRENLIKLISLTEKNLSEKQILFYFSDPKLETAVASHNWAGIMRPAKYDYLAVINSNIAGQKSDRKIQEKIDLNSNILSDGSIINTLTISRTHTGAKNEAFSGVRNVDWLRVYVPVGSQLLAATGFSAPDAKYFSYPEAGWEINPILAAGENIFSVDPGSQTKIYQENNKTVFANWTMVDPGETVVLTIKYRLPFNLLDSATGLDWTEQLNSWLNPESPRLLPYSLLVQKQAGARASEFSSRLVLSGAWPVVWRYPAGVTSPVAGWDFKTSLDSDKYRAIIFSTR